MSLYNAYKTDENLETDGIDFKFVEGRNDDGTVPTFRLARSGGANKNYEKYLEEKFKPLRRKMNADLLSNDEAAEILTGAFIHTVLKGWRFVKDESGKDIPFTIENAAKLFADLPELFKILQDEAKSISNFRLSSREDDSKN